MWIKICGTTTLEDAQMAVSNGADALGFIFAPSARRVSAEIARRINAELPRQIERYGVFVNPTFDEVVSVVSACGLTGVQLHRSREHRQANPRLAWQLREHFAARGRRLSILHAILWRNDEAESELDEILAGRGSSRDSNPGSELDPTTDAVLADPSRGAGLSFNWKQAQARFSNASQMVRMIAAGGLNAENVAEAVSILRPWGVDVASGVESAPGRKDSRRLAAFIRNARHAALEIEDKEYSAKDDF